MKGLILAGGNGTRLQPITHNTQKQLVPIANKPVIDYIIEDFKSAGITEIGVVLGGRYPEKVKSHLSNETKWEIDVSYIHQGEALGLAHAVACAEEFIQDDSFVVYFGDTFVSQSILKDLTQKFEPGRHDAGLMLQEVSQPSRYGIVEFDDENRINRIVEKPENPPSDLAYVGVIAFSPVVFKSISQLEPSWRGELELTDAINDLVVDEGEVCWEINNNLWKDVGTPEDVLSTNEIILGDKWNKKGNPDKGVVDIGNDSIIGPEVDISGPVIIGENSTVKGDSTVGPHVSIGDNCELADCTISNSVIMDKSRIEGINNLDRSIIAPKSTIQKDNSDKTSIITGDDTNITL